MTAAASESYVDIVVVPALTAWPELLRSPSSATASGQLNLLRQTARRRLVDAAQTYVLRLNQLAVRAGLPSVTQRLLTGDPDQQPLVMTGHQPVVFHSGLTFKYQITEQFAREHNAICVAVVIDTDEGDCGEFVTPAAETEPRTAGDELPQIQLQTKTLSTGHSLYHGAQMRSVQEIRTLAQDAVSQLQSLQCLNAATKVDQVLKQYAELSTVGATMLEASLITRWQHLIGGQSLELPLSAISCFPEILQLTSGVIAEARRFATEYNGLLEQYRSDQAIRNAANPFPNMDVTEDTVELPFWVVHFQTGVRQVLRLQTSGSDVLLLADGHVIATLPASAELVEGLAQWQQSMLLRGIQLVPRGALITAFLRLLFSDLFVHGTGGGKYDRFTDRLMESWWKVTPTPFTVVSASRYLFSDAKAKLKQLEQLSEQLRDLQFNPQRHFGSGVFSDQQQVLLKPLVAARQAAVDRMRAAHAGGESAKETGREIQRLTDQIKALVIDAFSHQVATLKQLSAENRAAVNCRIYPWFMF